MEELSVCIYSEDDLGAFVLHGGQGEQVAQGQRSLT